jgi:molybdopterin-containing oxidoreductase family membrane subunit
MPQPTPTRTFSRLAMATLFLLALLGALAYAMQSRHGLGVTGLSRDVPWGLYIAQFTFLVGIGASAVTVLLPYYVHRQKVFARALILGEVVAIIALCQALSCIFVDLGQPRRLLNILLYPSPSSLMFWDCLTLTAYLGLSVVGLLAALFSRSPASAKWVRGLALATIPWAIGIHVVTALLYAGLSARPAWMTAVLAPRFLATAFASGPALLILLAGALARAKVFDVGREAVSRLSVIMTYAAVFSLLLAGLEAFTALYSGVSAAREHLEYLFLGLDGHVGLLFFNYLSWGLLLFAVIVLLVPALRGRSALATLATASILVSVLVDKGLCLVTSGFVPSPLGYVNDYRPSLPEIAIVVGIYAGGALVFLLLRPVFSIAQANVANPDGNPERVPKPSNDASLPAEPAGSARSSAVHAEQPLSTARQPGMAGAAPMET